MTAVPISTNSTGFSNLRMTFNLKKQAPKQARFLAGPMPTSPGRGEFAVLTLSNSSWSAVS